jgi:predicted  nucleic acid-binding Zn-ribbon protein
LAELEGHIEGLNRRIGVWETRRSDFEPMLTALQNRLDWRHGNAEQDATRKQRLNDLLGDIAEAGVPPGDIPTPATPTSDIARSAAPASDVSRAEVPVETKLTTDDPTLEAILDAALGEIEKVRKELASDTREQVSNGQTHANAGITKVSGNLEVSSKRLGTGLQELDAKLSSGMQSLQTTTGGQVRQMTADLGTIVARLVVIEDRLNGLTQGASQAALSQVIGADGSVDIGLLLQQVQAQFVLCDDMNTRLKAIEGRSFVSPVEFATVSRQAEDLSTRMVPVECGLQAHTERLGELENKIGGVAAIEGRQYAMDQRVKDIVAMLAEIQNSSGKVQDLVNRCNKDVINARTATNALRAHTEETRAMLDESRRVVSRFRDELHGTDARIKKIVAYVQNETGDLATNMKDMQAMIDRTAERIETLSGAVTQIEQQRQQSLAKPQPIDQLPKHVTPLQRSPRISAPPVDVEVSSTFGPDSPREEGQTAVVHPPEKLAPGPPAITITGRRQSTEGPVPRGKPLPRVGVSQSRRDPEVTKSELKRFDDLVPHVREIDGAIATIRSQIERISRQVQGLEEAKAERSELQSVFEQFRSALGELNGGVGALRKMILSKADAVDLQEFQQRFLHQIQQTGETAGGSENIHCLLCGRPRTTVTGSIDDPDIAKAIGQGMSTRVTSLDGQGNSCFVYGDHGALFWGRSADGKPLFAKAPKAKEALPALVSPLRGPTPGPVPTPVKTVDANL